MKIVQEKKLALLAGEIGLSPFKVADMFFRIFYRRYTD
jgi:hypothetical protein